MRTIAMVVMGDYPVQQTRIPIAASHNRSKARGGQTLIPHSVVPLLHFGYFSITGVSGASAVGVPWRPCTVVV